MATNTVQATPEQAVEAYLAQDHFWPDFQKLPFAGTYRNRVAFWKVPEGTEDTNEFAEDAAFAYLKFVRAKGETRDILSRIADEMNKKEGYASFAFFRIIEDLLRHAVTEINVDGWEKRFKEHRQRQREAFEKSMAANKVVFAKERSERARHAALARHRKAKAQAA